MPQVVVASRSRCMASECRLGISRPCFHKEKRFVATRALLVLLLSLASASARANENENVTRTLPHVWHLKIDVRAESRVSTFNGKDFIHFAARFTDVKDIHATLEIARDPGKYPETVEAD
jgi:hypothetical protein